MKVYRGEKRLLCVNLSSVLAEGDGLVGTPTVEVQTKRGRNPTTLVVATPLPPAISGTNEITFWVDVPDNQEPGNYLAVVECATANTERVVEQAPLIVM